MSDSDDEFELEYIAKLKETEHILSIIDNGKAIGPCYTQRVKALLTDYRSFCVDMVNLNRPLESSIK